MKNIDKIPWDDLKIVIKHYQFRGKKLWPKYFVSFANILGGLAIQWSHARIKSISDIGDAILAIHQSGLHQYPNNLCGRSYCWPYKSATISSSCKWTMIVQNIRWIQGTLYQLPVALSININLLSTDSNWMFDIGSDADQSATLYMDRPVARTKFPPKVYVITYSMDI